MTWNQFIKVVLDKENSFTFYSQHSQSQFVHKSQVLKILTSEMKSWLIKVLLTHPTSPKTCFSLHQSYLPHVQLISLPPRNTTEKPDLYRHKFNGTFHSTLALKQSHHVTLISKYAAIGTNRLTLFFCHINLTAIEIFTRQDTNKQKWITKKCRVAISVSNLDTKSRDTQV